MPKRSNDFQRLIYLIRHSLADGATVTESKLMRDRITKKPREVDVVIEGTVGSQKVIVSVECRHHQRVADVTWVEQAKTKHDRLATNALILTSKAGFTAEARRVAELYGIELFTVEDVESADISAMLGPDSTLWYKTTTLSVEYVKVDFPPIGELESETLVSHAENLLYTADGAVIGPIGALVNAALNDESARAGLLADANEEHKWYTLTWETPLDPVGGPLCMQKLDPPILRAADRIRIAGPCVVEISRFEMRHAQHGDLKIAWGKATVGGQDAMLVASIHPTGEKKISIDFNKAK
jgi:hypothetical protein